MVRASDDELDGFEPVLLSDLARCMPDGVRDARLKPEPDGEPVGVGTVTTRRTGRKDADVVRYVTMPLRFLKPIFVP